MGLALNSCQTQLRCWSETAALEDFVCVVLGVLLFCICLISVHINILLQLGLLSEKTNHKSLVWRGLAWINQAAGPGTSRMSLCAPNNPKAQQFEARKDLHLHWRRWQLMC